LAQQQCIDRFSAYGLIATQGWIPRGKPGQVAEMKRILSYAHSGVRLENPLAGSMRSAQVGRMKGKFTAIVEEAPEGGYWAICPEVPGANGQGETIREAKKSLEAAVRLIFEDRVKDAKRGLSRKAIRTSIAV
jgi:predicted RNase H-like HicB family nuclease